MKVIGIVGSPRVGGNTDQLVQQILAGAAEKGAETKIYNLATMNIGGCLGCYACKKDGECVQKDDMQSLYPEISSADVMVVGTPVYMGQMTSKLMAFVERLLPFIDVNFTTRLQGNKGIVLAFTQGSPDSKAFAPYFQQIMNTFKFIGFTPTEIVVAPGMRDVTDFAQNTVEMNRAKELGMRIV
jgi:multimeric flavodoxin WrbA